MDALLIVDMQVGLLNGKPKHDLHVLLIDVEAEGQPSAETEL